MLSFRPATICLCLSAIQSSAGAVASWAQVPQYHLSDSIVVGQAAGDFYAIDPVHRRLYGAGRKVVDVDAKRVVASIADTSAENLFFGGFALAPELGRGVIRNGMVFTLASGRVVDTLRATGDASIYDPSTGRAFLLSDTVSVIDVKSGQLLRKVSVPGAKESGVADKHGRVYFNLQKENAVAIMDARSLQIVGRYSVAPGKSPMGLAIDVKHGRLFAACDGEVVIIDTKSGKVVAVVSAAGQSDQNSFDEGTGLLFEPGGEANGVTIIHEDSPDKYSITQTLNEREITVGKAVVDPVTHLVYVPHRMADRQFSFLILSPLGKVDP